MRRGTHGLAGQVAALARLQSETVAELDALLSEVQGYRGPRRFIELARRR